MSTFDFQNNIITKDISFIPVFIANANEVCPANEHVEESSIGTVKKLSCNDGYEGEIVWSCQSDKTWKKEDKCKQKETKNENENNNNKQILLYGGIGLAATAVVLLMLTM